MVISSQVEKRGYSKCPHCAKSKKINAPLSALLSTPGSRSTGTRWPVILRQLRAGYSVSCRWEPGDFKGSLRKWLIWRWQRRYFVEDILEKHGKKLDVLQLRKERTGKVSLAIEQTFLGTKWVIYEITVFVTCLCCVLSPYVNLLEPIFFNLKPSNPP